MKKCLFCGKKFDNNCFVYCNDCMDLWVVVCNWNKSQSDNFIDFDKIVRS